MLREGQNTFLERMMQQNDLPPLEQGGSDVALTVQLSAENSSRWTLVIQGCDGCVAKLRDKLIAVIESHQQEGAKRKRCCD